MGLAQPPCNVWVEPGESIQRAIDAASPGTVICLRAGTWEENLVINKSLTLRGVDREQTTVKGVKTGEPVILIESESEIQVTIEAITIAEAKVGTERTWKEDGIHIRGNAKAIIKTCTISNNDSTGIGLYDSSHAIIEGNTISRNGGWGIWVEDSAQAEIISNQITDSRVISVGYADGIGVYDNGRATIRDNTITGNARLGVGLWKAAQATIINNTITHNHWHGISMGYEGYRNETIQAEISENQIQFNRRCGVSTDDDRGIKITGKGNVIFGNREGNLCGDRRKFPPGFGGGR